MNTKTNANMDINAPAGALSGLKILDFTTLLPGPFATMNLADLGADVLRITTATRTDLVDELEPLTPGSTISTTASMLGRNKRILTLDLKKNESIEIVKKLISEGGYDVLVEQFRPGVMERLGLGYKALAATNPSLIYCSISGYGQQGSHAQTAGHDINYLSLAGLMDYSGRRETGPVLTGVQIADIVGGSNNAAISILAAVISRINNGQGQHIDVSMFDGAFALNVMFGSGTPVAGTSPEREGTLLNGGSCYDFYETADGGYISFGGLEPKFWANFCTKLGHEEWIEKTVEAGSDVKEEIRKIFRTKTRDEWVEVFSGTDACIAPVLSVAEAMDSELIKERNLIVEVPQTQSQTIKQIASPFNLSKTPVTYWQVGRPVAEADNREILKALGYSEEKIRELENIGVLR
ncbi:MAG: CoA transferase [Clostridiales Family XIII bacterium]|nr:CoA transferase [Clostridiales Family XIII bacterium]